MAVFKVPGAKQWIQADGSPTIEFFKFITNLFNATSGTGVATKTLQANISGGVAPPSASTLTAILDNIIDNVRGDIIVRGATVWQKLVLGANAALLSSNGTDLVYQTLSVILDAKIGSTRGQLAVRGAATWGALSLGTTGQALTSNGTDAVYALVASLASAVTLATGAASITTAGGDLTVQSSTGNVLLGSGTGTVTVGTTGGTTKIGQNAAVATVSAAFIADHRIQILDGAGNTYYVAVSNTAW